MSTKKAVVVDGHGHLMGRLASSIAKELLNGTRVVIVRCEDVNISGPLYRNRIKYQYFLNKRMNTNPRHGPFHYRAPSRIVWRTIRGMLPHKSDRGAAALSRLQVFEGVPTRFETTKRVVVPAALRNLRLQPSSKFTRLGDLSSQVGWKHDELIQKLEQKRKTRGEAYHARKQELAKLRAQAIKNAADKLKAIAGPLEAMGYPTA